MNDLVLPFGKVLSAAELLNRATREHHRWVRLVEVYVADCISAQIVPRASELAGLPGWAPAHLSRRFRRATGVGIATALQQEQTRRAADLLVRTPLAAVRVAEVTGFGSPQAFYRTFTRVYGITPAAYRRKGVTPNAHARIAASPRSAARRKARLLQRGLRQGRAFQSSGARVTIMAADLIADRQLQEDSRCADWQPSIAAHRRKLGRLKNHLTRGTGMHEDEPISLIAIPGVSLASGIGRRRTPYCVALTRSTCGPAPTRLVMPSTQELK